MKVSVLIPAYNELESLPQLIEELTSVLGGTGHDYEILILDDGSTDGTAGFLSDTSRKDPRISWIQFRRNFGKSAALSCGFQKCTGDVVFTMDADLQDDPKDIPAFLLKINDGFDLVCGWRKNRKDAVGKKLLSKIYNKATSCLTGVRLNDFNCGFKAYRKQVCREIDIYGDLHRYIPVLAEWRGFKIAEVEVHHRSRSYGQSKFGASRLYAGFFDLATAYYITRFRKKPSRFFYTLGSLMFLGGGLINIHLLAIKLTGGNIGPRFPYMVAGLILILMGVQLICTGLLSEFMMSFYHRSKKEYSIESESTKSEIESPKA